MAIKLSDNQVFVLREKGHFYYETRPIPTLPSENQVTVAVGATGLCGSDVCTVISATHSLQSRLQHFL
jgi:threonine dehydrogenase-like Zn-dependent dehydrogenase